jgi:hypothetical protein
MSSPLSSQKESVELFVMVRLDDATIAHAILLCVFRESSTLMCRIWTQGVNPFWCLPLTCGESNRTGPYFNYCTSL